MVAVSIIGIIYISVLWGLLGYTVRASYLAQKKKKPIILWGVFGFISNFIILSAYYVTLPLEGVSVVPAFTIITIIVTVLSLILGCLYAPLGLISWYTRRSVYRNFFSVGFSFLIVEILRPYIFTIVTWGGGSTFGAHGSSWAIGSTLAPTPLLAFAHFGGTFTLGLVLIYCVGIIVYPLQNKVKIIGVSVLMLLYAIIQTVSTPKNYTTLRFGILQTSFTHVLVGQNINKVYKDRVQQVVHPALLTLKKSIDPEIIILPEDIRYLDLLTVLEKEELRNNFPDALIVDGATRLVSDGRKNVSLIYDTKTDAIFSRNKGFMFPFGEYVPYAIQPFIKLAVGEKKLYEYQKIREYTAGVQPYGIQTRKGNLGILVCSELTSYSAIVALKNSNPDIVIVQSSLTWTHANPYYIMNHIFSLKILAVMLGKPVISVTNSSPSIMVDAFGNITSFEESGLVAQEYILSGNTIQKIK